MTYHKPQASLFVPDRAPIERAFQRITHLGIGAHQDDLEIMAYHGILQGFTRPDLWFGGVVCTDGSGSPRAGTYAGISDRAMAELRQREQEKAAVIGKYSLLVQLNYTSLEVKDPGTQFLKDDLQAILSRCRPSILYTHNLADKHDTHLAVAIKAVEAVRGLPREMRPKTILGCEVWRSLDWLDDEDKVPLDVSGREDLAAALIGVFDSQIAGGKNYLQASLGRRRANASYFRSHEVDAADELIFAMDLTPLAEDDSLDMAEFVIRHVQKFRNDVEGRVRKYAGPARRS